MLLDIE